MRRVPHVTACCFAALGLLCLAAPVVAQEPALKAQAAEAPPPEDPSVAAILETKPTTPAECIRVAKILVELGRPALAKPLVKKVLDAKLDRVKLAELGEQIGAAAFLDLAAQSELSPEARQLSDAVVDALDATRGDAKRIAALIAQLQDPKPEKRIEALAGLQEAGGAAIGPLLAVLADPARSAEHENVRTVLVGMGRTARHALAAVVAAADPKLKIQAILTLAEMKDPKAAIDLVWPCVSEKSDPAVRAAAAGALKQLTGRVPTRPEAVALLTDAAKGFFDGRLPIEGVADGRVDLWRWDQAKRQCVVVRCTPEDAGRAMAAQRAYCAHALAPDDREIGLLYVAAALDAVGYDGNLDFPFFEDKLSSPKALSDALKYAMIHRHPKAAALAAEALGRSGNAEEVLHQDDKPAPLVQALQDPDRVLRMAALRAIMRLRPTQPFAGSSDVTAALRFFAASSGIRRALVGSPNTARARDLAGWLAAAGLQTDTASNGKDLLMLAARSPDYELALIDVSIDRPVILMLVQQLRHDRRTASLRVGLIARDGYLEQAERLARNDAMTKAFPRPHDEAAFKFQMEQLATLAPREFVSYAIRQQQAAEALDMLADLSRESRSLYDLRLAQDAVLVALHNPKLAVKAMAVLANLNSAESQRALVDFASLSTHPLADRQAAAKAFGENLKKHGILLTTREIQEQYRRYNASETQDAATQHLLGLILNWIEAPTKKATRSEI